MDSIKYKGLLKGSLQIIILKLLQKNGRMYGYEITQVVKEITNGEILLTEGALYPALHKLEKEGLLAASVELVDNRARKYYTLSEKGRTEVEIKLKETKSFMGNLDLLLNLNLKLT
ncbi:PadR family transcriptional regulator [Albibacterium bauzanense]|uniref:PadR family transcriptional regulator n=1 Tax=Albibacterium bauzanense TaxID=653929 RepID=A0A4R1M032_9SPHI|nr:helix-turn-helix transcriptional regulator [Albibacterium bauzanense]TCK84965.1 PadR family transcriptional regulator [Albibacterium bauzanense]